MRSIVQRLIGLLEELFGGAGARRWAARSQISSSGDSVLLLQAVALDEDSAAGGRDGGPDVRGARVERPRAGDPFLLSVDDAGQFLVVPGARVTVGHLRAGVADLLFLAGIGPLHASLSRSESLAEGPVWTIHPEPGERSFVNGVEIGEPTRLAPGDRVRLGENLSFRMQRPDPASHTIVLELLTGSECDGAKHVVLLGEGPGGRLRIGAAAQRHVRVPNLEHEITFFLQEDRLFVQCESGVAGAEASEEGLSLPCPPPQRFDLSIGKPAGSRPPFGLAIEPSELPRLRARHGGA